MSGSGGGSPGDSSYNGKVKSLYSWETTDDAQTFVSNSSEVQHVSLKAYQELQEKLKVAEDALAFYANPGNWYSYVGIRDSIGERDVYFIERGERYDGIGGKLAIETLDKIRGK